MVVWRAFTAHYVIDGDAVAYDIADIYIRSNCRSGGVDISSYFADDCHDDTIEWTTAS